MIRWAIAGAVFAVVVVDAAVGALGAQVTPLHLAALGALVGGVIGRRRRPRGPQATPSSGPIVLNRADCPYGCGSELPPRLRWNRTPCLGCERPLFVLSAVPGEGGDWFATVWPPPAIPRPPGTQDPADVFYVVTDAEALGYYRARGYDDVPAPRTSDPGAAGAALAGVGARNGGARTGEDDDLPPWISAALRRVLLGLAGLTLALVSVAVSPLALLAGPPWLAIVLVTLVTGGALAGYGMIEGRPVLGNARLVVRQRDETVIDRVRELAAAAEAGSQEVADDIRSGGRMERLAGRLLGVSNGLRIRTDRRGYRVLLDSRAGLLRANGMVKVEQLQETSTVDVTWKVSGRYLVGRLLLRPAELAVRHHLGDGEAEAIRDGACRALEVPDRDWRAFVDAAFRDPEAAAAILGIGSDPRT